jgi:hypothetical protein
MLNQDTIREATRLTHAGELAEATALLQRMLRGVCVPDATSRTAGRVPLSDRELLTIDAKVNDVEEADSTHLARPHSVYPAGSSRYSTEQRMALGSECEA